MNDARLKSTVKEILENCRLEKLVLDREVHINFTGKKNEAGTFVDEKEFDVVAKFACSVPQFDEALWEA